FRRALFRSPEAPTPGWIERRDELLEIAEARGAAYVYERRSIEKALDELGSLESVDAIYYAMKANPHPDVLRTVHGKGANFECVSPGEIRRVLELFPDIDRKRILCTPTFAPRAEYEWATEQGVWLGRDIRDAL